MIEVLWEPFTFEFMRQAMAMAMLVAMPMAVLSAYIVLKGWSLMGDAISHAVLPGVVLAVAFGLPVFLGAFLAGILSVVAMGYIQRASRIKGDTVIGVVFMGLFGLGLVLHGFLNTGIDIHDILFGDLLGIDTRDLIVASLISLLVLLAWLRWGKDMMVFSFDPLHARAIGLNTRVLHFGFLLILTLAIVGSLKSVGMILPVGFLVIPGVIGQLLTKRFFVMQFVSVLVGGFCALLGTYLSFFLDSAPAATIVMAMMAMFIVVYTWVSFSAFRTKSIQAVEHRL